MAERKLVMDEKDGSVLIGVSAKDCDPLVRTVEGNLEAALDKVPAILAMAQERWTQSPRNPAYRQPPKATPRTANPPAAASAGDLPLLSGTRTGPAPETPASEAKAEEQTEAQTAQTEEPAEVPPEEATATVEETAAGEGETPAVPPAPPASSQPTADGKTEWEYYLKDGRGPYADIQAAMDAMGMDRDNRPHHNRWDRLSSQLKEQIQHRPKQP